MNSSSEVQFLTSPEEKDGIASALAKLAAPTEMSSYGEEQWQFLLHAGDVEALVISKPDTSNKELLGCVLRIGYGSEPQHQAFGMMLVSKEARGQGLAKKLLKAAMGEEAKDSATNMKILGTCTELGRPMYEKLGFQRVSTVTRLTISCDKLQLNKAGEDNVVFSMDDEATPPPHLAQFLELDQKATGLDRSKTLKAIMGYPYVKMATLTQNDKIVVAALVTQHTNSNLATVGPIVGDEEHVPALLQGIRDSLPSSATSTNLALIVSDHPSLVQKLKKAGFETAFELGAMTMDGVPMPGDRNQYLGLIHPTLG